MPDVADSAEYVRGFRELSREMMAAMLDQSVDCVKILDPSGRVDFMNRNGLCLLEIDDFRTIARQPWDALWPEEARERVRLAVATALSGGSDRFTAFCPTAKGTPKWWEVTVSPIREPDGGIFALLSTSRDMTERQQSMESMETMAHEMRHRLRNAFAVSGAIALASGREQPAHQEFAQTLAQRFTWLSIAQSKMLDGGEGQRLDELAGLIADGFDRDRGLIRLGTIPPVVLGEQQTRLTALVLGELCTNSLKHGALHAGRQVDLDGRLDGGTLILEWAEALGADPAASGEDQVTDLRGGAGFGLMERMARAHGARFEVTLSSRRLQARLEMPVQR